MKKRRDLERLVDDIASQPGVRVRPTRNGWYFTLPVVGGTSLHRTPSDIRAMKNFRSIIRQAGLTWPGEEKRS